MATTTTTAKKTTRRTKTTAAKATTAAKKTSSAKKTTTAAATKKTTTTKKTATSKTTISTASKNPTSTTSSKITKSKTLPAVPASDEVSFVNNKVSKTKYTCRLGRKSGTVHLSMSLRNNDGIVIETDYDVERIVNILLINYNIGIVGICDGVYTYEFDKEPFCRFLLEHNLIEQWIYDYCCVDRFK